MTMITRITCSTHPGNGAPINLRRLDRSWRDAAQIEQGEAERRMHEARLNIGAYQHAEPDEIDAELVGDGRQQRDDDEGDLEEIEEEGDHEDEGIDEDQEADLSARQRRQQILDPYLSADALKHEAEGARADQDVDHHGGDAHGGRHPLIEQRPRERAVRGGERDGADHAQGSRLGGRGQSHEDGPQHQEDQSERGNDAAQAFFPQRPALAGCALRAAEPARLSAIAR